MAPQPLLLHHAPVGASSAAVPWSDTSTLHDLARMHAISADAVAHLAMPSDWSARWTTAWRFGRTLVGCAVRDLSEIDVLSSVPVRRFTWRTDQRGEEPDSVSLNASTNTPMAWPRRAMRGRVVERPALDSGSGSGSLKLSPASSRALRETSGAWADSRSFAGESPSGMPIISRRITVSESARLVS